MRARACSLSLSHILSQQNDAIIQYMRASHQIAVVTAFIMHNVQQLANAANVFVTISQNLYSICFHLFITRRSIVKCVRNHIDFDLTLRLAG